MSIFGWMLRYFKWPLITLLAGLFVAYARGAYLGVSGLSFMFTAFAISLLEIAISFDNAVVNAVKLRNMSDRWRRRFLTWGILIAVFGMRFVFPILIVAAFSGLGIFEIIREAFNDPDLYVKHLHAANPGIVSFGGMFLAMLFFKFFIDAKKDVHWLELPELVVKKFSAIKFAHELFGFALLGILLLCLPGEMRLFCGVSGLTGIALFALIEGVSKWLEKRDYKEAGANARLTGRAGFAAFMYLELIDASFSLDGVLGAFAFSKDVVIIAVGLAIGAMFVRSLTIMLVEKQVLERLRYLANGAYWAIGALSVIMLVSTVHEIHEAVAAVSSVAFIMLSLVSSMRYNGRADKGL